MAQKPNPLVGSWESEGAGQPQVIQFGADNYFMQADLPLGRPKSATPLAKMTQAEIVARFDHIMAARGSYSIAGNTVTRKHLGDLDPGAEGTEEVREFRIESAALILKGSGSEARFRRLPAVDDKPNPVVGSWERIWLLRDGNLQQPPSAPEYVSFSADGHFMQMEIHSGRAKLRTPLAKMTLEELVSRFDNAAVAYGTYTVAGNIATRKHLRSNSPGAEGFEQVRGFRFEGEILNMRGPNANGSEANAWFRRMK